MSSKDNESKNDNNIVVEDLETLLPDTKEMESKEVYIETLEWALENKEIQNLAITGTYGSGKSSILKTFWKGFERKDKVLEISAASFSEDKTLQTQTNNENPEDYISIENALEQHIMQQMFYKVKSEKIPSSRFTRIQNLGNLSIFFDFLFSIISILLIYISVKYGLLKMFLQILDNPAVSTILPPILGVLIITYTCYKLFRRAQGFRLSTLGIGNTTIELSNTESTVFNRYLDEIIYFFSQTDFNIVVFEDLDRFDNLNIFERLRGLNHILNQSEEINKNIVFVYALKDDIFSKDDNFQEVQNRTKFFDFIIPTVKIMHSSNSESILLNKLDDYIKEDEYIESDGISKKLITDVSLFINDMRILKNICNEYIIYKSALKKSGIIQSKLFAMIVYKNIYPKDYSDLLNDKGDLNQLLNLKNTLINEYEANYQDELKELEMIQKSIEDDFIDSLDGLVITYLRKMNKLNLDSKIELSGVSYRVKDTKKMNDFLIKLLELSSEKPTLTIYTHAAYQGEKISFDDFCSAKGSSNDILIRAKAIIIKEKGEIDELKLRMIDIQNKIAELQTNTFSELIKNSNEIINKNLNNKELLKVLLLQGWIDDDYDEYITYFYEGLMFKEDIEFLKNVRLNIPYNFNYKLNNKAEVLRRLSKEHFYSQAIMNHDLFDYLLQRIDIEAKQKRKYFIDYIGKDLSRNFKFVNSYLGKYQWDLSETVNLFVKQLSESNDELWNITSNKFTNKEQVNFLFLLAINNSLSTINNLNNKGNISTFINDSHDFLSWWKDKTIDTDILKKLSSVFNELKVNFKNFDGNEKSPELIKFVIDNNFYEINQNVLSTLLGSDRNINYEVIRNHTSDALRERVEKEIDTFVEQILLKQSIYVEEEEEIVSLLNNKSLSKTNKIKLIENWSGIVEILSEIKEKDLFVNIVQVDKMKITWRNIEDYYESLNTKSERDELIALITKTVNFTHLIENTKNININEVAEDCYQNILKGILLSKHINDEQLKLLLNQTEKPLILSEPINIEKEKYRILIDSKLINWNLKIAEYLYDLDQQLSLRYFNLYRNKISDEELTSLVENYLLPWDKEVYFYLEEEIAYEYLISSTENFVTKLEQINCNAELFLSLLDDGDISLENKLEMISSIRDLNIKINTDIINWLVRTSRNEDFSIVLNVVSKEMLEDEFLKLLKDEENISFILFGLMNKYDYTNNELYLLLESVEEPFSKLTLPGRRNIEFNNSTDTMILLSKFKEKELIASITEKDNLILVNNKKKI